MDSELNQNLNKCKELAQYTKDGQLEIIYRTGKAQEFLPPVAPIQEKQLDLTGNSGTILEFLRKRKHLFASDKCHINVHINSNIIYFVGNECEVDNQHSTWVKSILAFTEQFAGIFDDINKGSEFAPKDLANYLRRRKNMFQDAKEFQLIFTSLSTFQADIQKKIEQSDDKRGTMTDSIKQTVTSNLPNKFTLRVQPFENVNESITFEVEIDINATSLECEMLSFDLDDKLDNLRKAIINDELDGIIDEQNNQKLRDFCVCMFS